MSQQVTTKNFLYGKAPRKIELLGDKTIRPEPATHIIEFPGGAIELSRTTDGNYWAHIIVNRDSRCRTIATECAQPLDRLWARESTTTFRPIQTLSMYPTPGKCGKLPS